MRIFSTALVSAGLISVISSFPANSQTYSKGTFKTNAAATISCKILSLAGGSLDSTFTFTTTAAKGDSVVFSLPVNMSKVGIVDNSGKIADIYARIAGGRLELALPRDFSSANLSILNIAGRTLAKTSLDASGAASIKLPFADGLCILHVAGKRELSARIIVNGASGRVSLDNLMGTEAFALARVSAAPETAQYQITVSSNDPAYGNIAAQTVKFASGSVGVKSFSLVKNVVSASQAFAALFPQATYESMFPHRYGMGKTDTTDILASAKANGMDGYDFYAYAQWIKAIDTISQYTATVYYHTGDPNSVKVVRTRKSDGSTMTFKGFSTYDQGSGSEVKLGTVDFADFCNTGTDETRAPVARNASIAPKYVGSSTSAISPRCR